MPKKRVIAHYMHERERDIAMRQCAYAQVADAYVVGDIEEGEIAGLEAEGLIVEVIGEAQGHEATRSLDEALPPTGGAPVAYYLVHFSGPLMPLDRALFEGAAIPLVERLADDAFVLPLTDEQVSAVGALPFVRQLRPYGPEETASPLAAGARAEAEQEAMRGTGEAVQWDILLHDPADVAPLLVRLESEPEATVIGSGERKIRVEMAADSPLYDDLLSAPTVARLDVYVPPTLQNDVARELLGVSALDAAPTSLTGAGQIIAVADTGLDQGHPDFAGRIVAIEALGRPGNSSDPHGHGTHVAGSALGDGAASAGQFRGVAPGARLYFQSLLDPRGGLGGLPVDLGRLFDSAYRAGARIHNNSWGSNTASTYTVDATEVDGYVAEHRDLVVLIAAGNEGNGSNPLNAQLGFVDWLSICSPASCKNALTVGASRSRRKSGGLARRTYGTAWPQKFPQPPIAREKVSGNPEGIAAFSSRGPTDDRRIKPDVVAPGTDILSARSLAAPAARFWGEFAQNGRYAYMGGSSMATPLVAGCAALVREYYERLLGHAPSAALVKATIINGTRWLSGTDAVADHGECPNYHQGFGMVHMPWTLPHADEPELKLAFVDPWKERSRQFQRTGERRRFRVTVGDATRLRLCLAYTDPPGRAIQNDLNLFLEHLPSGKKWLGNEQIRKDLRGPDRDNNVEIIRFNVPEPGDYLIQISASTLLRAPQDFALVVTGDLQSPLVPA